MSRYIIMKVSNSFDKIAYLKDWDEPINSTATWSYDIRDAMSFDIVKAKEIVDFLKRSFYISNRYDVYYGLDHRRAGGGYTYDADAMMLKATLNHKYGLLSPSIQKVIFNDPATIILWSNGQKTVVKCDKDEEYDPEKGMAMAISKYVLGNQGNYYNEFKKWLPENEEEEDDSPWAWLRKF